MTDAQWLEAQQREHNLASFSNHQKVWPAVRRKPRKYRFTREQVELAMKVLYPSERKAS